MIAGRFVAATIVTPVNSWIPSISFKRDARTPSCTSPYSPRDAARASISSYEKSRTLVIGSIRESFLPTKNMIEGAAARALRKISLTALSDSPTYLLSSYINQCYDDLHSPMKLFTHFRSTNSNKVDTTLTGQRPSRQRLATPRRSVQ